jgi:hypothetical protein
VWVSEELDALAATLPDVNWSAALAAGIRALAGCEHHELECSSCGAPTTRAELVGPPLEELYRSIMFELGLKVAQAGYEGAARIVRRVATDHGVPGLAGVAVPRATAANHRARLDAKVAPLPTEAASRRRHPTAHPIPDNHPGPMPAPTQEQTA